MYGYALMYSMYIYHMLIHNDINFIMCGYQCM